MLMPPLLLLPLLPLLLHPLLPGLLVCGCIALPRLRCCNAVAGHVQLVQSAAPLCPALSPAEAGCPSARHAYPLCDAALAGGTTHGSRCRAPAACLQTCSLKDCTKRMGPLARMDMPALPQKAAVAAAAVAFGETRPCSALARGRLASC